MRKNGNRLGKRREREIMGLLPKTSEPILPGIPQDTGLVVQTFASTTSGPLPDPKALAEYDKIKPGFAERIVAMAEEQAAHRRRLEAQTNEAQVNDIPAARAERRMGQCFGIVAVLATLVVALFVGTIGQGPWAASLISSVPLTGLVVAFIAGRPKPESGKVNGKK